MRMSVAAILLTVATGASTGIELPPTVSGKSGEGLRTALRNYYRPSEIVGANDLRRAVNDLDRLSDGTILDRFAATPAAASTAPIVAVAPLQWWTAGISADYGDTVGRDLHNLVSANSDVVSIKGQRPPGVVLKVTYNNGVWHAGTGLLSGQEYDCYSPPRDYRGDFARAYLYMSTIYPPIMWGNYAITLFTDSYFPGLTDSGLELLLDWHRSDPVDELERSRCAAIAGRQGNVNPFVVWPDLVEYIWGDRKEDPFTTGEPDERLPLRSTYSLADEWIDLYYPAVEGISEWRIDGRRVEGTDCVAPASLGLGEHEITFVSPASKGKLRITVRE